MLSSLSPPEGGGRPRQHSYDVQKMMQRLRDAGKPMVVSVGRSPQNEIHLDSALVPLLLSRHHAVLTVDDSSAGVYLVTDVGSTNGTFVRDLSTRTVA